MSQTKRNYSIIRNVKARHSPHSQSLVCFTDDHIDQEAVGKLAELDMIVAELERANNRVAAAERRNVRTFNSSNTGVQK